MMRRRNHWKIKLGTAPVLGCVCKLLGQVAWRRTNWAHQSCQEGHLRGTSATIAWALR
jgi:hypothetical protein